MKAAIAQKPQAIQALIQAGANVNARNAEGITALSIAEQNTESTSSSIVQML